MGHDSQDTFTARMQNILRIAHGLREATATSNSPALGTSDSDVVIESINLPSPRPLLPSLLEAGADHETAAAMSKIYQLRSEEFRQCIQESITIACHKAAEFPTFTSALPPDLLTKKMTSIFTEVYVQRLEEWKEEFIQRIKQASKRAVKAAPRNSRTFNHEYVPLLEHFFDENPFPTHADKVFLAKKSNMQYRQIHVWFQNRRSRTKPLRKKPICEGATNPLDQLYECMKDYMVDPESHAPRPSQVDGNTENEVAQTSVLKDAFASTSPPHAFPSLYPPTCHYNPFPCKYGSVRFSKPMWRRVLHKKLPPLPSTSINDLVERFSHLNVRDETRSRGSPKLESHAATVAITVIPSRAPHPSLIIRKYIRPTNIVQLHRSVPAPTSRSKSFRSPSPTSKPGTLIPFSVPPSKSEFLRKRKTAPLPQRFTGRMRNSRRDDITPSESPSTSSSSPRLSSTDSEGRSCSPLSVSALSAPSDVASIHEVPRSFESSCRSPFDSPFYLRGLEDVIAIAPSSVS